MSRVTGALAESDLLMAALHESMRRLFGECFPLSVRAVSVCLRTGQQSCGEGTEPGQKVTDCRTERARMGHDSFSC